MGAEPEADADALMTEKRKRLNMDEKKITQPIAELREMQRDRGNPERSVLETAMFLEDVFGIRLEDSEMDEAHLGSDADLETLTSLVVQKLGGPEDGDRDVTGSGPGSHIPGEIPGGLRNMPKSEA